MIGLLEDCLGQCWQSEKVFSSSAAEDSETEPHIRTYNTGATLSLLHMYTPLWEEWLLPTVLQSSSQCSLGHRGEGPQWSPPLGSAGEGAGGKEE